MRKLLILVVFLVGYESVKAQHLTGTVSEQSTPLSGAVISNKRFKTPAVSDGKGDFIIVAAKRDTLITTLVGYKPDTTVITNQAFLIINLQPRSKTLSDVIINSTTLSPLDKFKKNQSDYKQIYRIGDDKNAFGFGGGLGGIGLSINIDKLYSALSKEGKDARRLQKVLVNDYHADIVNSRFTDSLVSKITGYKDKQLDDFMINNRPSYEFVIKASDYDLVAYIKRRIKGIILPTDSPEAAKSKSGLKVKVNTGDTQQTAASPNSDYVPKTKP
jgi:hypothetical protein